MDDERLLKGLFYGDVAMGSSRQGGQIRRYKDTLKVSLKRLHINSGSWEGLMRDRQICMGTVGRGAAINEVNGITAAKTKCEALDVPGTNRPHRTSSNPMRHQHDNAYILQPTVTPVTADHNVTDLLPPPTDTTRCATAAVLTAATTTIANSPTPPHRWDDIQRPINFKYFQHPHLQLCGLSPCLFSLRSHTLLTHRPSRSLTNPSHRDWRTIACSTNLHSPHPLQLPSLLRTSTHHMGHLGHMLIHENLR
ncbi:hypothetical protein SprV_0200788900 [Sparganum proliferum]